MEHDDLCPRMANQQVLVACQCDLIAQVRADERGTVVGEVYDWVLGQVEE